VLSAGALGEAVVARFVRVRLIFKYLGFSAETVAIQCNFKQAILVIGQGPVDINRLLSFIADQNCVSRLVM